MSITGTIMAFVGLAAVKRPSARDQEREEMLEHLAYLEAEAVVVKAERDRLRAERDRLFAGAHRCQWQAQLNRAMQAQQDAQAQLYAQINAQQSNALNAQCGLALEDCNMHRAEVGQLWAQGPCQGQLGQGLGQLGQGPYFP